MIKYNFTAGLLTNQGSGGSKYDLVAFSKIPTYNSVRSCFSVGATPAAYLRTDVVSGGDNTLFYKDTIYFRMICDITALNGTMWGTEIDGNAVPIRAYADVNNIYIGGGSGAITNNGLITAGRNDLTFKLDTITGNFEIKNKINGKSSSGTSTGILKANMSGRNLYLGCANFNGSVNFPMSNIDLYTVYFGYDEGAVTGDYVCYLKKGETYYTFNNTTGEITSVGNKITFEMLSAATKNKLPADIVNMTGYDVVIFNTEEFSSATNLQLTCHDVKTEVYVSDVDVNSYLDKDGALANIGVSYGLPLETYNIDSEKDVILRIPETSKLKIHQDFLNTGNDFIREENTVGPDIGVRGEIGVKNMAIYGHSKTDSISVSKANPLEPTFTGLVEKSKVLVLGEIPAKTRIETKLVEVTGVRTIDGIDNTMKSSYDVYSSLVEIAEDEDMFNDSYVIDGSGSGVSNITVNVGNFIEIKLPDDITDILYPEFMSLYMNKLKGVPQKSGNYTIRFKLDGREVTSKLTVIGVTRIK